MLSNKELWERKMNVSTQWAFSVGFFQASQRIEFSKWYPQLRFRLSLHSSVCWISNSITKEPGKQKQPTWTRSSCSYFVVNSEALACVMWALDLQPASMDYVASTFNLWVRDNLNTLQILKTGVLRSSGAGSAEKMERIEMSSWNSCDWKLATLGDHSKPSAI